MAYSITLPDGAVVTDIPDDVKPEDAKAKIIKKFPQYADKSDKSRTTGEAFADVGASVLGGIGSVLQVPGQLTQLVPGLYGVGSALAKPGGAIADFAKGLKSQGLLVREALRDKAVSAADKEGLLSGFATAITETIKDPALLSTFFAEQLPQLIGPAAAVKVARLATASKVAAAGEGIAGLAAQKAANVTANRAAMGTGAAMQGADVSSDTFDEAMAYLAENRPELSEEQRRDIALNAARKAGAIGLAASGLSMALPGAQAIERRLAGMPGVGRIKSALGESGQEIIEEGGGQFGKNVALQPIDPTRELLQGVGSAAGLGALGGGALGGVFGGAAVPPELMEGQMAGETARQSAERLQQEINDLQGLKAIQAQQDAEALQTGLGAAMTAKMPLPGETPLRPPPRRSAEEVAFNNLLATTPEEQAGPAGIANIMAAAANQGFSPSSTQGRAAVDSLMVPTDRAAPTPAPIGIQTLLGGTEPTGFSRPAVEGAPEFNELLAQSANPYSAPVGLSAALGGIESTLPSRPVPTGEPAFNRLMSQDPALETGIAAAIKAAAGQPSTSSEQGPATPLLPEVAPSFEAGLNAIMKSAEGKPSKASGEQGPATPLLPKAPPKAQEAGLLAAIQAAAGIPTTSTEQGFATPLLPPVQQAGLAAATQAAAGKPSATTAQGPATPLLPKSTTGLSSAIRGGAGTPTKTRSPSNVNNLNVPEATDAAIQQEQAAKANANVGTAGGASVPVVGGQGVQPTTAGAGAPEGGGVGVPKPDAGGAAGRKAKQPPALKKSLAATTTEPEPEVEDEAVDKQIALKKKQLQAIMLRIMSGMGLRDVGLKLIDNMEAEGEYANQLITLALNVDSPVRVLRHESIHAMKAMGLFSPQQWETLRKEASTKWIKQFLGEGKGSRFEQYQKLFKDQGLSDADANEAMIEEAIADAFGEFDLRGAPAGLMSAILKRMQNMFAAIKSAFGGTETAEQILQRAEKGKLQGRGVERNAPKEVEQPEEPEEPKASLRRAAVPDETEISTQNPQAVNRRYDPIEQMLSIDQKAVEEAMELNPELYDSITDAILRYGFIPPDTKREDAISVFKKNIVNNLLFLHDAVPKDIANRSKLWYDGAHIIAKEMAKQYDMKMEQVAGIFAAMSPQKDWFQNVSMGERAIDILTNQGDATWDDNMLKYAESYIREPKDRKEREKRQIFFDKNIRQTSEDQTALKDMDIENAAAFIRAFDEAYNSRQYRIVTPEGGFAGLVNKKDGDPAIMTWSTYGPIEKAVSIFRDPSRKNISEQLGEEHKIRSFYNNIAAPNADIDHVTIDTHAVAAGLFEALAGSDKPVAENFGSTGGTNLLGVGGTYGIIADAYREAAKARGVQAREMQSITWEAIRGLFTEELKSGIKSDVRAEWEKYKAGEQSFNEARDAIVEIASKNRDEDWRNPDWIDSGPGQTVADGGASYDKDFVPAGGVRLRNESVLREKLTFNLSAVTNSIPGLKDLYQKAMSGDQAAYSTLQKAAESSLRYLLSGTSARITVDYAKGVYLSDREPSIAAKVAFSEEDRPAVLAALERFASNYNQYAVHVRQGTAYPLGTEFDDGSYATAVFTIDLQKNLTNEEIGQVLTETNLEAFTVVPTKTPKGIVNQLVAYWCKLNSKPQEEQEDDFKQFKANLTKAAKLVGVAGKKPRKTIERLFVYADDDERSTHTYGRIRGDVSPKQGADTETPRVIADYIRGGAGTVVPPKKLNKFQVLSQKLLASVQEALPVNDLKKPLVRKAYNAANVELAKQFAALPVKVEVVDITDKPGTFYYDGTYKSGTPAKGEIVAKDEAEAREQLKQQAIDVDKIKQRQEPYANSAEMRKDVSNNNVLKILKTQAGSFGPEGVPMSDHPLLEMSEFKDINKVPLLYNDMLRAVHDYYAHGVTPAEFGPVGEATAWLNHMATTMSPLARWVITAETRLQNAWQNFRPGVENIPLAERPYALQKAALPPVQFALTGKADIDAPMLEFINTLTPKQQLGSLSEKSPLVSKIGPATTAKFSIRAPNTKEFKQWFGRSTIVDAEGNPKVMYHGTARDITAFRAKQANAIFITEEPTLAENYAYASADWMAKNEADFFTPEEKADARRQVIESLQEQNKGLPKSSKDFNKRVIAFLKTGDEDADSDVKDFAREALIDVYVGEVPRGANILPVFVKSENPFDYENPEHLAKIEPTFRANENGSLPRNAIQNGLWSVIESDGVQKAIRESGFDGFYVEEGGIKNLAVYNPEQIKSATGNQGTFDINNPDIRKSLRSTLPAALIQRVDQTTVAREDKGFISRILKAISPGDHTSIRAELLNRYNQLSVIDKMRVKKMGGAAAMADISAESAALLSDLGAGITASALGVHDKVGGAPVYVQSFYVVRNGQILPRRYKTRALAQASAGPGGEVRSGGHTSVVNFNGDVRGPLAIFAPLAAVNDPMIYQLYQFWAAAKRGKRLTKEGREELLTPADQAHAQFLEKKYPMFVQVQKDFIKYNNKLVDYMVDTGVLSPERGQIYTEHADYLPFYRQMEGQATAGPKIFASISGVKPPKALKGGEARLDDFLETIVRNTQSAIQAGVKNVAAQRAVEAAKDVGLASKLPQNDGMPTTVVVHENGVPTYYSCGDVAFINAMKSLGMSDIPFLSILSMPANFLRAAVTKEPTFMLANMLRDSLSSYVTSGVKMTPVIDTAKNFAMSMAGKSPQYDVLRRAGIVGGYEFAQGVETSGRRLGEKLKKANVKSTGLKRAGELAASPVTGVWQFLEKGSEASDAATRIEIYKRTLAETGNETEALFKSLEVMNFNRKGRSAAVRVLTAVVPFLNARMQGLDILYRSAIQPSMPGQSASAREKELQHKFLVRGVTMAALSSLYWALTSDDEEYKKQEQDTKDNHWLFPSLGIKIPIPFEIGVLFKVVPERIMALAFGDDSFKDFRKSMTNQVISTLNFNPIPQAIIPIVENITNHSFYTGRDIVSPGTADLEAGYQTAASTSSLMADFGKATGLSPIKLEHAIQGYTGQMGMYLVSALDAIYEANSTIERPAKRFEQLPLIKRFAVDPEARGSVTSFFELKDKVDAVVKTINVLERGDPDVYDKYIEANQDLLASKDYINALASEMKDLAKAKVMIRASDDSAEEKRDALLEIQQIENDMTANMQELKREFNP